MVLMSEVTAVFVHSHMQDETRTSVGIFKKRMLATRSKSPMHLVHDCLVNPALKYCDSELGMVQNSV